MSRIRLDFYSEALARQTYVNILLPGSAGWGDETVARAPLPVLYLLHGLSDNQDSWLRSTAIERYCWGRNLAVVMPTTDRAFYTDTAYGIRHYTYIAEELPLILRRYLPLSQRREDTYAAGLSMGGHGAMKLALRNPERFSFAAAFSTAAVSADLDDLWRVSPFMNPELKHEMECVFGLKIKPEDDLFRLLERCAAAPVRPKLYACCGERDGILPIATAFAEYAIRLEHEITWETHPGYDHEWPYWDRMIRQVLDMLPEQTK